MGKYIFGVIAVLVLIGGTFFLGFTAGIRLRRWPGLQMDPETGRATDTSVCIVDGVRYVPEEAQVRE